MMQLQPLAENERGMAIGSWLRPVGEAGFVWRDDLELASGASRSPSDDGPWLVPIGEMKAYPVLQQPQALLRAAEQLGRNPTPEAIRRFADHRGSLGIARSLVPSSGDGWYCDGESLTQWQQELAQFEALRRLWRLAAERRIKALEPFTSWASDYSRVEVRLPPRSELIDAEQTSETEPVPLAFGRRKIWLLTGKGWPYLRHDRRDGLIVQVTKAFVRDAVNEKLRGHMSPAVIDNGQRIRFYPDGLLSALYWLFARELVRPNAAERECPNPRCPNGGVFLPRRKDQQFCDANCRKAAWYHRQAPLAP